MNYCVIDGKSFDVVVTSITETFNILNSDNSGRTTGIGSRMVLDPLGTFYGHTVKFKRKRGHEEDYDELFRLLSYPRYGGIHISMAHDQSVIEYDAYVSQGQRELKQIDPKTHKIYWGEMSIKFTPMEAQITP